MSLTQRWTKKTVFVQALNMRSYSAIRRAQEGKKVVDKREDIMGVDQNSGIVATSPITAHITTSQGANRHCVPHITTHCDALKINAISLPFLLTMNKASPISSIHEQ